MSDELGEKIIEVIDNGIYYADGAEKIADAVLSLPSGLEVWRPCDETRQLLNHPKTCLCHGTGEIVMDMTVGEAIKIFIDFLKERESWSLCYYLPDGGRVRVKKEES